MFLDDSFFSVYYLKLGFVFNFFFIQVKILKLLKEKTITKRYIKSFVFLTLQILCKLKTCLFNQYKIIPKVDALVLIEIFCKIPYSITWKRAAS